MPSVQQFQESGLGNDGNAELFGLGQLGAGIGAGQQVGGAGGDVFRDPAAALAISSAASDRGLNFSKEPVMTQTWPANESSIRAGAVALGGEVQPGLRRRAISLQVVAAC